MQTPLGQRRGVKARAARAACRVIMRFRSLVGIGVHLAAGVMQPLRDPELRHAVFLDGKLVSSDIGDHAAVADPRRERRCGVARGPVASRRG